MRKLKIILPILGLLLSFVTMGADNSAGLIGTTYTARINAPKAVVYADENMLSPLGYIANGKAIKVGNPRRMNRDLVPLIISGRLAFIEIKDIRYENSSEDEYKFKRGAPLEHDFDKSIQKPSEVISQNNSFYLSGHRFTAGSDVENVLTAIDGSTVNSFMGFQAQFIHRQTNPLFWGVAIDYSSISSNTVSFSYWMLSPTIGYTLVKKNLFNFEVYASLDLGMNTNFKVDESLTEGPSGFIWGPQVNARLVFFPEERYHALVGIGLRKYAVSGLEEISDAAGNTLNGIKSVSGVSVFLGVGIEFR